MPLKTDIFRTSLAQLRFFSYISPRLAAGDVAREPGQGRKAATATGIASGRPPATKRLIEEIRMIKPLPKHVLVLDGKNSTEFLEAQNLVGDQKGAARDSSKPGGTPPSIAHPALMSADGIQFYRFRHKLPRPNSGQFIGPEHLEYWTYQLRTLLQKKNQPLDAIAIPSPGGPLAYDRLHTWLEEVKAIWPQVKVLVIAPSLDAAVNQSDAQRPLRKISPARFVRGTAPEESPEIKPPPEGQPWIDGLIVSTNDHDAANALRHMIELSPLPTPVRDR